MTTVGLLSRKISESLLVLRASFLFSCLHRVYCDYQLQPTHQDSSNISNSCGNTVRSLSFVAPKTLSNFCFFTML